MKASDRIKAAVSLRQLAEDAGAVWDRTKTRTAAGDYWAPCPLHGEATASFHVVEKGGVGGLFKCFGCGVGGSAVDFVMALHGISAGDAIRRLTDEAGLAELDPAREAKLKAERAERQAKAEAEAAREARAGLTRARSLWSGSARDPAEVGAYLTARGVNLSALGGVPATLRYQADLPHWGADAFGAPQKIHVGGAMIGAVGRDRLVGVHRTWITPEGRARFADGVKVPKKWAGETGSMFGQPCVLSRPSPRVVVGEGIETTLAAFGALVASGVPGWSAEAALSRGAITGPVRDPLHFWTPRPGTETVLILGEGSSKRPHEAQALYEGARARIAALGLQAILRVPYGRWDLDHDFADVALADALGAGK